MEPPGKIWTEAEYLAMERGSEEKHEFSHGQVFAMAGASREHNDLALNIGTLLCNALTGRLCRAIHSDMPLKTAVGSYRYADASALCGRREFSEVVDKAGTKCVALTNPDVIFEVLSHSTEALDRGKKFEEYRSIPSFKEYVLVSSSEVLIEHFVRQADGTWPTRPKELRGGDELKLTSIDCALPVDKIYARVFDAE